MTSPETDRDSQMTHNAHSADLMDRIRSRRAVVGIIGLGYVGLPLALAAV